MAEVAAGRKILDRTLRSYVRNIHETLQMIDQPASTSAERIEWSEVVNLGGELSKQATIAGMLWCGEKPGTKQVVENMATYFNVLQGFLLLCHASTAGAGPTLLACIQASARQIVDSSLSLFRVIVSLGDPGLAKNLSIPQLCGSVWEACAALKKTPTRNYVAIGRALTQIAVSIKDVLREMKELKPAAEGSTDGSCPDAPENVEEDDRNEDDFGTDLSQEEMNIAQWVICAVSDTLAMIKELIRFITGSLGRADPGDTSKSCINTLEELLKHCQSISQQIDELGACVYPPQEVSKMIKIADQITIETESIFLLAGSIGSSTEELNHSIERLKTSLKVLLSELATAGNDDPLPEMEKLKLDSFA